MKTTKILSAIIMLVVINVHSFAQKDRILSKGMSLNFEYGLPSDLYACESNNISQEYKFDKVLGFQMGSRWYFNPAEKYGIGLMINWLDVTTGKTGTTDSLLTSVEISMIEIGPVITFAITDKIGFDAYYNFRPTGFVKSIGNPTDMTGFYGYGFSHAIGGAFRFSVLNIGAEYVIGNIKCQSTSSDISPNEANMNLNSFRLLVGFKF